jgi:hypothetical protein
MSLAAAAPCTVLINKALRAKSGMKMGLICQKWLGTSFASCSSSSKGWAALELPAFMIAATQRATANGLCEVIERKEDAGGGKVGLRLHT